MKYYGHYQYPETTQDVRPIPPEAETETEEGEDVFGDVIPPEEPTGPEIPLTEEATEVLTRGRGRASYR